MKIATGQDDGERDRWFWENRVSKYFPEPAKDELAESRRTTLEEREQSKRRRDQMAFAHFSAQVERAKRLASAGGLAFAAFVLLATLNPVGSFSFFALLVLGLGGWGVLFCGLLRWRIYRALVRVGRRLAVHLPTG